MITWSECKRDFQDCDGSLRDIYITPATLADWRAIYPLLRSSPEVEFSVDGITRPLPDSVEEALEIRRSANPALQLKVGQASVVFHFFTNEEIECDFFPNEIKSQVDLDALLAFLRQLGDATCKPVVITPENCRDEAIISYAPKDGGFTYQARF